MTTPVPYPPPDEATASAAPTPDAPAPRGGLSELLLMRGALESAQARQIVAGTRIHQLVARARSTAEAAVALAAARPSLRHSDGTSSALLLAREAIRLASQAHLVDQGLAIDDQDDAAVSFRRARDEAPPAALAALAPEIVAAVEGGLSRRAVATELPVVHQELRDARVVMDALLAPFEERLAAVQAIRVERVLRAAAIIGVVAGLVGGSVFAVTRVLRGPNLALGKHVTMSSSLDGYSPKAATDGVTDALGVHSNSESRPWLQVDLGMPLAIRTVVIHNRSDFGEDRAVPMVLETSLDGTNYTQAGRRDAEFHTWTAKLPPTNARYVRIRVDKTTFLHINELQIFGR